MILLTGATGYVGGRLLKRLEADGRPVRCLARAPEFLQPKVGPMSEVVAGDVLDPASLEHALRGVDTAYYLIHSMGASTDFEKLDRQAAANFSQAARAARVRRIIYLGGLGDNSHELSPHLRSRQEVGDLLRSSSGAQVIEFRASIVIGSGSLSFEMVRALVERLPVMTTPRWVLVKAQPIAITDLLEYLTAANDLELTGNPIFEIGGADQVSYSEIMREYARQRGLRRWIVPIPVLTPGLSSLWLALVTPVYARVGRRLINSIRHPTVVRDDAARRAFPTIRPKGIRDAVAQALRNEDRQFAETHWSDALSSAGTQPHWGGVTLGSRRVDSRMASVRVPPAQAFAPIRRLGGQTGWYYATWLWQVRGFMDLLFGGVGLRRGRRDPDNLRVGDVVDFWRVEVFEPDRRLVLRAEMKLPGRAWLEFMVQPQPPGSATIRQTAIFDPVGVLGRAYWYLVYPLHALIFRGMLRALARRAEQS